MKNLRTHGGTSRNQHDLIGYNSRLDEIQVAVLNIKLSFLSSFIKKRRKIAEIYCKTISNDKIRLPFTYEKSAHTYNQFTLRVKNRNKFIKHLEKNSVPYGIYYSEPIYNYKAFSKDNYKKLPIAESISKECISIPIYPELALSDVKKISTILNKYE